MTPDPEKVRYWETRAGAYDRLCHRWDIFSRLSNRLIDLLPAGLSGTVLDIGSGTGLTSELLLARHPHCRPILIEPSQAMIELARRNLAGRDVQFLVVGLDGPSVQDLHASAAIASASMQFVDFEPAFATLARILEPGGHLVFNLWWHHWEETADRNCMTERQSVADAACMALGMPVTRLPPRPTPKVRGRAELMDASSAHGFRLCAQHCDEDPTPAAFGLDFDAMDPDWPAKGLSPEARDALLARMRELAEGTLETLVSTRFLFQKTRAIRS